MKVAADAQIFIEINRDWIAAAEDAIEPLLQRHHPKQTGRNMIIRLRREIMGEGDCHVSRISNDK